MACAAAASPQQRGFQSCRECSAPRMSRVPELVAGRRAGVRASRGPLKSRWRIVGFRALEMGVQPLER